MKYVEFRQRIRSKLASEPEGMTWSELREALDLPYLRPCPEWVKMLERDIGLTRNEKRANTLVWRLLNTPEEQ